MKYEFSAETRPVMRSPVAKVALSMLGAAALVLAYQILERIFG